MSKSFLLLFFKKEALVLALLMLCLVAAFINAPGTFDDYAFIQWGKALDGTGPFAGYGALRFKTELDYPPVGVFLMWLSLRLGHWLGWAELLSFKSFLALGSCAGAVLAAWRRRVALDGLLLMLVVTPFGLLLGYTDVVYLPWLMVALYAADEERFGLAGAALAVAALIKWQPIILAPLLLLAAFRSRRDWRGFGIVLAPTVVLVGGTLALFGVAACFDVFVTATKDEYLSGQGANIGWLMSWVFEVLHVGGLQVQPNGDVAILQVPSPVAAVGWAMTVLRGLFYAMFLGGLGIYAFGRKTRAAFLISALGSCLTQFTCNSGVHENHLFPGMVVAFVAWQAGVVDGFLLAAIAVIAGLNVLLFYGVGDGFDFIGWFGADPTVFLALAEVIVFAMVVGRQIKLCLGREAAA
jgi:hypothetical protein